MKLRIYPQLFYRLSKVKLRLNIDFARSPCSYFKLCTEMTIMKTVPLQSIYHNIKR